MFDEDDGGQLCEMSKNKPDMIDFFRLRSNLNLNRAGPGMSESVNKKRERRINMRNE